MKTNKVILVLLFFIVLAACETKKTETTEDKSDIREVSELLIGQWHNLEIEVVIKREKGDSVAVVPYGKWEEILKIKPIVTSFNPDSTFVSEYRSLDDEIMMTSYGTWFVKGDSLIMSQDGTDNAYFTQIKNDTVSFSGYIDWDQDGEADDFYTGTQIKH